MYEQTEYSAMILGEIGDNYFSNIERQAKDIENNIGNYSIKDDLYIRYAPPLKNINKQEKILDYGCGQAIYSLTLYFMGYHNMTLVDVPNIHFKFLEFLCNKYGLTIKFIPIESEFANISESYDYIICTDVLEHCWDPIKVLRFLVSKVNPGKLIYVSDFYDDAQGTDPFHLKHNFKYQNPKLKIEDYTNLGIELFSYEDNLLRTVWKKV